MDILSDIVSMQYFPLVFVGICYFAPTIIAIIREACGYCVPTGTVLFANLFFGWTGIGWAICAMICWNGDHKSVVLERQRIAKAKDNFYLREEEKHQP